jgi:ribosomal protein S18 acetylase RimI-like enzyme
MSASLPRKSMPMAITIRDALAQELDLVRTLTIDAYREYAQFLTEENWQNMQASLARVVEIAHPGQLIVAERDQQIVGSVVYFPPGASDGRLFEREWASLRLLAVPPQHRGHRLGLQLSVECIKRARQDEADYVGLHTSELMVVAQRMYERLGFLQEGVLPGYFGIKYWRYVLKLSKPPIMPNLGPLE